MPYNKSIALVTPIKNELDNLPLLIKSVEEQTHKIALWILLDDASTDGSTEYLNANIPKIKNVENVLFFYISELPEEYKLGSKYSQLISYGFNKFFEYTQRHAIRYDFIGILDSDCFPHKDYYRNLLEKFIVLHRLGIASGIINIKKEDKKIKDKSPSRWAHGGIRVWRMECFVEAGYMIGQSADAISSARAWTTGWQSQSFKDSIVETRELGARVEKSYYGESAYYLYVPFYYMILRCLLLLLKKRCSTARNFYRGYSKAMKARHRIKANKKVIWYFRMILLRNIYENIIVFKNNISLLLYQKRSM